MKVWAMQSKKCFSAEGTSVVIGMASGRVQGVETATLKRRDVAVANDLVSEVVSIPSTPGQFLLALQQRNTAVDVQGKETGEVLGSEDSSLWRVDLRTGELAPVGAFSGPVAALAQSADGTRLAWSSVAGTVILYDVTSGQQEALVPPGVSDDVESLAFSLDGEMLATGDRDGRLVLWSLAN